MSALYEMVTRIPALNRLVHGNPRVIRGIEQAPVPVTLPDGVRRIASYRLLRLAHTWAAHDDETRRSFDLYRGGDVIDVGAFHGWYSVALAAKARPGDRFLSLEPDRAAFPELLRNLAACSQVFPDVELQPMPLAAGDGRPARVTFPQGSGHPRYESAGDSDELGTMTVDGLVGQLALKPTFVKVDVEGAEFVVLQGMRRVLEAFRPVLMLEVHPRWQPAGVTIEQVESLVRDHGYECESRQDSDLAIRQWWRPAA